MVISRTRLNSSIPNQMMMIGNVGQRRNRTDRLDQGIEDDTRSNLYQPIRQPSTSAMLVPIAKPMADSIEAGPQRGEQASCRDVHVERVGDIGGPAAAVPDCCPA